MYYKGVAEVTPDVQKVLSGAADAKTTDYGHSCKVDSILCGSTRLMLSHSYHCGI